MILYRIVALILIFTLIPQESFSARKNRSLKQSLKAFIALNRAAKLACQFDDDDPPEYTTFIDCDTPMTGAPACSRVREAMIARFTTRNLPMEMNCKICGLPVYVTGYLSIPTGDSAYPSGDGRDYYSLFQLKTSTSLQSIKDICAVANFNPLFTPPSIKDAKDFNSLFMSDWNASTRVYGGEEADVLRSIKDSGKECPRPENEQTGGSTSAETEIADSTSEENLFIFGHTTRNLDRSLLNIKGLPHLIGAWEYRINDNLENKNYVQVYINSFLKSSVQNSALQLSPEDSKNRTLHLIFDSVAPEVKDITKSLNENINLTHSMRIINPHCETNLKEKLNISIRDKNGKIETQRYVLNCKKDSGKKIISLTPAIE